MLGGPTRVGREAFTWLLPKLFSLRLKLSFNTGSRIILRLWSRCEGVQINHITRHSVLCACYLWTDMWTYLSVVGQAIAVGWQLWVCFDILFFFPST